MKQQHIKPAYLALAVSLALSSLAAQAQQAEPDNTTATENSTDTGLGFERIVVTGAVSRNQTVMQSSVSVSSLTPADIEVSTPRSTAFEFGPTGTRRLCACAAAFVLSSNV